ncbi:hypothetical protein NM688_g2654 [Phlebia brevispora]|uniref:Uncharacterized protein n=1 Tax=Phlebia brevispora TaxID=194682 RepID=A0ACC1T8M9_9APHY|nr:hypothetical protein NM688_g2654 [Phlebia brevispora]
MSGSPLESVRRWFGYLSKKLNRVPRERVDYEVLDDERSAGEESIAWNREPLGDLDCMCARSHPSASKHVDQELVDCMTESLTSRYELWKEWNDERASNMPPQSIVIYSDEELRENANLDVPLQIKHTTTSPVISSSLASEPCERLGIDGVLSHFNELLGTSYSVETPGLRQVLERCIDRRYDFGMAFGRLRMLWFDLIEDGEFLSWDYFLRSDFTNFIQLLEDREQKDEEDRRSAFNRERNLITNPDVGPRRLWDLFSNRVVPSYAIYESYLIDPATHCSTLYSVSHSWMAAERRQNVDTPINGHEWRVPLPDDTTLDRIRIELLNLGAEYVWLDVLCLRQEDNQKPENEELRKKEWELDVPTIGSIYRYNYNIITYFSGLGRPFEIGDITSERHWLNRAWTLQEGSANTLIGGLTAQSSFPSHMQLEDSSMLGTSQHQAKQVYNRLCMALYAGSDVWPSVFPALEAMLNRIGTCEVDRIAGLAFMLRQARSDPLAVYLRNEDNSAAHEEAWHALITKSHAGCHYDLAFLYPMPGDGNSTWRPSWRQLAARETPLGPLIDAWILTVDGEEDEDGVDADGEDADGGDADGERAAREDGTLKISVPLLRNCRIQLLAEPNVEGYCRRGKLTVHVGGFIQRRHLFTVEAHHQQQISEDQNYVLVGRVEEWLGGSTVNRLWIVGVEMKPGSIRKVTTLRMDSEDERDRLEKLNLATETEVTLI